MGCAVVSSTQCSVPLTLRFAPSPPGEGGQIHRAEQLDHIAGIILYDLVAADDIGSLQAHLAAGRQAEELLGRVLHKVLALDEQVLAERHLAIAHFGMRRMVSVGR